MRLGHQQHADDDSHQSNDGRVPETEVDVSGLSHHGERRRRQQTAEPTVADVVGQRQAGVADARREQLHQCRGHRAVHHRHVDDEDGQDADDREALRREDVEHLDEVIEAVLGLDLDLDDAGIVGLRITSCREGRADLLGEVLGQRVVLLVTDLDARLGAGSGVDPRRHHGRAARQSRLGDVATRSELGGAGRVELERAFGRVGGHLNDRLFLRGGQSRIGGGDEQLEQREHGESRDQAATEDDRLAADLVRQVAEDQEAPGADDQRPRHEDVGREVVDLEDALQEEQGVELAEIPDDGLAGDETGQGEEGDLGVHDAPECGDHDEQDADSGGDGTGQHAGEVGEDQQHRRDQQHKGIARRTERVAERRLRHRAFLLDLQECRALVHLQADVERDQQQQDRDEEGNAPAPGIEGRDLLAVGERHFRIVGVDVDLREHDDDERQQQTERGGRLNEARVVAASVLRSVLGDVDRRAAVLAAERQALGHAQCDERHRRRSADRLVAGQAADEERRQAHDQDGDEEGVLAADEVAETTEEQRAERAHQEAGGEGEQREHVARRFRVGREELLADDRRKRAIKIEIIPFEDGTGGRGHDDLPLLRRHRTASFFDCCRNTHWFDDPCVGFDQTQDDGGQNLEGSRPFL